MSTPAPHRPEPAEEEQDVETVIRHRMKTYQEDRQTAEDWETVVKPALLRRHPPVRVPTP
jgi:hypothetical protein